MHHRVQQGSHEPLELTAQARIPKQGSELEVIVAAALRGAHCLGETSLKVGRVSVSISVSVSTRRRPDIAGGWKR